MNSIVDLIQRSDKITLPLDDELSKTRILDRISLILTGYTATLQLLFEQLQAEVNMEGDALAMEKQFEKLFEEEQRRFNKQQPLSMPPPTDIRGLNEPDGV